MSIVKMKALTLLAPKEDIDLLLRQLQQLGCVALAPAEEEGFQPVASRAGELRQSVREVQGALEVLRRYAPWKSSFLAPRRPIREREFWDEELRSEDLATARRIQQYKQSMDSLTARQVQLENQRLALLPWAGYDLPLELSGTRSTRLICGTLPAALDLIQVQAALSDEADTAVLREISTDKDLHYLVLLVHQQQEKAAVDHLRGQGFAQPSWNGLNGTAEENLSRINGEIERIAGQKEAARQGVIALADRHSALETTLDCLNQQLARAEAGERLCAGGSVMLLKGWLPEEKVAAFRKLADSLDCAWELRTPTEEEYGDVPVQLKNNFFTRCMNMVTNMYGLPRYGSLDPNPLMAPFFILFYGFMMADMGYGLLMILGAAIVLKKKKPTGGMRDFCELLGWCGISTFLWGAATGGFFGDFIPQIVSIIRPGTKISLPALFTPLDDTVAILLGSLILGLIQVITGMAISVYKKCRDGQFADALWNEITWYILLAGVAMAILGVGNVAGLPLVLIIGGLMLIYGCTYQKKGFGKITSLIGTIYNGVTGYFSDILSYLRLMALMLAGSVIAQVFNTLGAVFGNVLLFIVISMVGNLLNFVLNLLGCYVHDLRLQCLEFFNRFFEEGGKPYQPLTTDTKHVEIIKEEQSYGSIL